MKRILLVLFLIAVSFPAYSQTGTGGIKGRVVNRSDKSAIAGAALEMVSSGRTASGNYTATSDADGDFVFEGIVPGDYAVTVSAAGFSEQRLTVTVEDGVMKNVFYVSLLPDDFEVQEPVFMSYDDGGYGFEDVPLVFGASADVFESVTGYDFSSVRFRPRGYDNSTRDVYLAGIKMNDAVTGYSPYSLWSGLNEAVRAEDNTIGLDPAYFGVGGYNGQTNIFGTASQMRKGFRFSLLSNSALYRLRLMASYATGEMDNGWSFAANISTRLGGNDWVEGVYYKSFSYYFGAEKNLRDRHRFSLSVFGAPVQRGAQNASTQEVYDLVGSNYYNSNWGYQNGVIRNARVRNNHEPVLMFKYRYTPKEDFELSATVLYRTGRNGYSALDWYDTPDPRPDYYRNLPSYFYNPDPNYKNRDSEFLAGWAAEAWMNNYGGTQHINWDRMYNINYDNVDANGLKRSKYVLEERRTDQNDVNISVNADWRANDFFTLDAGANFRWNRTEFYKTIKDLLGGDYYVNIDQFAERDFATDPIKIQNDVEYYFLHGEAQKVKVGDKYGYDYYAQIRNAKVWANANFEYGPWRAYLAVEAGYSTFWREGLVQKGLFLDNSKGKSEAPRFSTYSEKAGVAYTYKAHRFYANIGYFNEAPYFNESFVSPRTRNTLTPNLTTQKTFSVDVNYAFSKRGYDIRFTAYYTTIKDQSDLTSFYDDAQNSFTNFAMSGIDQRNVGIELGFKVPLPVTGLSLSGAASIGDYVYTSIPRVTQTIDNSGDLIMDNREVAYWMSHNIYKKDASGNYVYGEDGSPVVEKVQKHYVGNTPQIAATLGLNYRTRNYLFIGLDLQYFDKMYLEMNPLYRTDIAVCGPDNIWTPAEEEYMAAQETFAPQFILNASIGKSWYIDRKYNIGFSLEIKNILNNKWLKTGGYEQSRLIDSENDERYYRFDSKYFYMQGINYMLNIYFRF